ncbi:MAG: hypothetical protein F4Z82_21735 [Caldilineaceae bacterium SB0668_bin_21]|nr:hypothetical protein [Caldilineaceae bacterium SB0668_bin_21]MYB83344.1 hypothetical protein [Chloroflexota bacterium]
MATPGVVGPAPPPHQPGGARIPRLQELTFLVVAMRGVAEGVGFEQIRRNLIEHMIAMRLNSDATGNTAPFRIARDDPRRYVSNVSEALKELMRLGLVEVATVPSSARAARNYATTEFAPTSEGVTWAQLLQDDLRSAYDHLLHLLWNTHPQFAAFLKEIDGQGLVIPLLPWSRVAEPVTRDRYLRLLPRWVSERLGSEPSGWIASESEIGEAVGQYLADRYQDARDRRRDEPYPKNRDFVGACEEALVKFAFAQRGVAIDYISHQIVRRWTKELGVANYSYHVPGSNALRLWSTASIGESAGRIMAERRIGQAMIERAIDQMAASYEEVRRGGQTQSPWVPIYRVRASVCWSLRTQDAVFDRALRQVLTGDHQTAIPFGINVDMFQHGNVPPTELPLRLQTRRGIQTYYAMSLVPKRDITR